MKKILILACIILIYSCKNSITNDKISIYADETVLIVNYQIENMSMEEHSELGSAVAPSFTSENVPGLLGKSFIGDLDRGVFGGLYYFSDSKSVDIFLESDLWKGVVAHPNLVNFKTDIFKTFDGTELANGNHSMRKTSSDALDAEGLHILVVNYTNEVNPSDEEMSSQVKQYAPVFSNDNFPGMIGKTMINSIDGNIYGGYTILQVGLPLMIILDQSFGRVLKVIITLMYIRKIFIVLLQYLQFQTEFQYFKLFNINSIHNGTNIVSV